MTSSRESLVRTGELYDQHASVFDRLCAYAVDVQDVPSLVAERQAKDMLQIHFLGERYEIWHCFIKAQAPEGSFISKVLRCHVNKAAPGEPDITHLLYFDRKGNFGKSEKSLQQSLENDAEEIFLTLLVRLA